LLRFEKEIPADPGDDVIDAVAGLEIGKHERFRPTHHPGVALHYAQVCADMGCKVDLIDHEEVGACDAGTSFPRYLIAAGNIDDVNGCVNQFGAETGRKIVATAFEEQDVQVWKSLPHLRDRVEIDRRIFAYGRMRASAGFDADDAIDGKRLAPYQKLHIF